MGRIFIAWCHPTGIPTNKYLATFHIFLLTLVCACGIGCIVPVSVAWLVQHGFLSQDLDVAFIKVYETVPVFAASIALKLSCDLLEYGWLIVKTARKVYHERYDHTGSPTRIS